MLLFCIGFVHNNRYIMSNKQNKINWRKKNMKKVVFKISVKSSSVKTRKDRSVLLEAEYDVNDSAYIKAIATSYYKLHVPNGYRIISPKDSSELVKIDESTNNYGEIGIIGFGHGYNMDDILIEVVSIKED